MKLKIIALLVTIVIAASACTKKIDSNGIIINSYDSPTYTNIATSYTSIYRNTYFITVDNAISVQPAYINNIQGIGVFKRTKGTGFQSIYSFPATEQNGTLVMANDSIGYCYTNNNNLYKTSDGGYTWKMVFNSEFGILGLVTPDINTVYFISYSTVYKSTDGGVTWSVTIAQNFQDVPNAIYFYNSTTGFIALEGGTIKRTTDGGQTWSNTQLPTSNDVTDMFFTDANTGYATAYGDRNIYGTTNGGQSWAIISENDLLNSGQLYFYPDGRGIIAVLGEYILYTRDYGKTTKLFLNIVGENSGVNINAINDTTLMLSADTRIYKVNFSKNKL